MRILLVAPDQVGIDSNPEVDLLSSMHRVRIMQSVVTRQRIYNDVRNEKYDVIHFVTHSDEYSLSLSDNELLSAEDVAQIARLGSVQLLFFNSCTSGRIADYSVRHGVPFAIHTNTDLSDESAWKMPLTFYRFLKDQDEQGGDINFIDAFISADTGEGIYGLSISHTVVEHSSRILEQIKSELIMQNQKIAALQRQMFFMIIAFAFSVLGIIFILTLQLS